MEDTYEPPFKSCVEHGKASCLMCPCTSINGVPSCANGDLLQKVRKDWGFMGFIASGCDAVATIYEYQFYAKSPEDAVAEALKAGSKFCLALLGRVYILILDILFVVCSTVGVDNILDG